MGGVDRLQIISQPCPSLGGADLLGCAGVHGLDLPCLRCASFPKTQHARLEAEAPSREPTIGRNSPTAESSESAERPYPGGAESISRHPKERDGEHVGTTTRQEAAN